MEKKEKRTPVDKQNLPHDVKKSRPFPQKAAKAAEKPPIERRDEKSNKNKSKKKEHPVRDTGEINPKKPRAKKEKKPKEVIPLSVPVPAAKPEKRPLFSRKSRIGKDQPKGTLRIVMLGGLQEIGKNLAVIEYGEEMIVVDCGIAFPDEEMPGVDLVIPDITYLERNKEKIRAILITHGHEDHIGGIPYVLQSINPPIYGTRLSLGILSHKFEEHKLPHKPILHTVEAGDTVKLGAFTVEFIHANHSIADACCLAIRTPLGVVFHTGDFKLDVSPIDGNMMDIARIGAIGNEGVLLMMGESTNAERPGFTPSERKVGGSLSEIFEKYKENRIVIATFSSNVHRVQQIIDLSVKYKRKVAVLGRSMVTVAQAAVDLGYMSMPSGTLVDVSELRRFKPEEITLITTGSQGEPMSALYRMAFDEHDKVHLSPSDVVVLSSSAIPGNEKLVGKIVNALVRSGVKLINDTVADVHVSGHACQEELKMMLALVKPRYFMPIHGEQRHLYAHKELAEFMGIDPQNIFVSELGKVLEIDRNGARFHGTVPSGKVLVDGSGVGDVGNIVLRDRKHLAQDGIIIVVATVDMQEGMLLSGPDVVSRGFVYVREAEELMDEVRRIARASLEKALSRGNTDFTGMKNDVRDDLGRFLFQRTKRRPMILPIVMDL